MRCALSFLVTSSLLIGSGPVLARQLVHRPRTIPTATHFEAVDQPNDPTELSVSPRGEVADADTEALRDRLRRTPTRTAVELKLKNGETVTGRLAEVDDTFVSVWVKPDQETRRRLGIGERSLWKRKIRYDEVESVKGLADEAMTADDLAEDLRFQPFVYGSIGGFSSGAGGGGTFGWGGGIDFLVNGGVGLGVEMNVFGNSPFAFAVASANVTYHFIRGFRRSIPFVKVGIGSGGEMEFGGGGVGIATLGGGVNLWNPKGFALRVELLDRFPVEGGDHHIGLQFGVTF